MRPCNRTIILAAAVAWHTAIAAAEVDTAAPDFHNDVLPLLKVRCVRCHGPAKREAELNLALPLGIKRGGESGPAILPGKPDQSPLWQRVAADEMPPEDEPLTVEEKETLRRWIAAGAPGLPEVAPPVPDGDEHWAFQSLHRPELPQVRRASHLTTPIDRLIQAELESVGLSIGPEADRETLIRRVSYDLTGLPPTPAEIATFLNDSRERAYENMVERYFASPHYGERWGKYWLDAAGYADSNGYFGADTDRPLAYRYRDYVIRSLNTDKPWDQFIREQLAGDELAGYRREGEVTPQMVEPLEAVHYLRNSPDGTDSSDGNPDEQRADKYAVLDGTLQIIGSSLLGITVQCARCHDHKFEPFSQRDYYQLQAVIYPAFNVENWVQPKERQIVTATVSEIAAWEEASKKIDKQLADLRAEFASWMRENRERGRVLFHDDFDDDGQELAQAWSNAAPGDEAPAGQPAVNIDSPAPPGAQIADKTLRIVESRDDGDRAFCAQQVFDWTPNEEAAWIQVTFDLVAGGDTAPYVGYFIALRDFNDTRGTTGGNVLVDGTASGKAGVHVDYPGSDSDGRGQIGESGYTPGRNYGARVTNIGNGKFELAQTVDGLLEENTIELSAEDLPDGGFGFEYCCGRSFVVDNVLVEASDPSPEASVQRRQLVEAHKKRRAEYDAAVHSFQSQRPDKPGQLAVVSDLSPDPPPVPLLERGDYKSPQELVVAAAPAVISSASNPAHLSVGTGEVSHSTGRRLALARWLTQPDSRAAAVLARVTVNRWWQKHFGTGIVATPDNLGYSGAPPTHPELLEYLAAELVDSGWSTKAIHRQILNSAVYRQVSMPTDESRLADGDGRLLSRFPLRRLDAEAIRDGMLAASGELDLQMFGPYVSTSRDDDGDVVVDESVAGAHRRSVYLQQRRTQVPGMLEVFDAPSIVLNCTARTPTTVPIQSLKLLNSDFVRCRATALAERIESDAGDDAQARIRRAFVLCLSRTPTECEFAVAEQFLAAQPGEYPNQPDAIELAFVDFCHMLLASNAFLYID